MAEATPHRDIVDVVDVVVVGAGVAGTAAAYSLASRGASVVIVEQAEAAGYHATGRSASVLSATSGLAPVCRLANASRPFFERPPSGFADVGLLSPRGLLWIGQVGDAEILDEFAVHAAQTTPVRRLTTNETMARLPGFRASSVGGGAVAEDEAMAIDTAALLDGLLRGVRQAGGRLLVSTEAVQCRPTEHDGYRWQTVTSHGVLTSRHVVNAAGAWADVLATRAGIEPVGMRPLRRTAAVVPVAAAWEAAVAGWPLVMDIAGRFYCEPETGGLLLSPADETLSPPIDARPEEEDVAWAHHGPTMTTAPTRGRSRRVVGPCPVCGAMPVVSCADTATAAQVASEQSWTHLAVTSTGEFRSPTGAPIPEPARPPRRTEPIPFRDLRAALVDGLTAVTR